MVASHVYRVVVIADDLVFDEVSASTAKAAVHRVMRANGIAFAHRVSVHRLSRGAGRPAQQRHDVRIRLPRGVEVAR